MPKNPILSDLLRCRERQVQLGMTVSHDDTFKGGELVLAGLAFALHQPGAEGEADENWPFKKIPFIPSEFRRDNLITAMSFLMAEIERCDRAYPEARDTSEDWKEQD